MWQGTGSCSGPEHDPVPCHNDLLAGNYLRGTDQIWVVDWEYAGMGDRYFDLANFAVNHDLTADGRDELLAAYFGDVRPADVRAFEMMRFMSLFREAMWGVVQTAVSELEFDFAAYAEDHFERAAAIASEPSFGSAIAGVA